MRDKKARIYILDDTTSSTSRSDLCVSSYRMYKSELVYTCDKYEYYTQGVSEVCMQIYIVDKEWDKLSTGRVELVGRMGFSY